MEYQILYNEAALGSLRRPQLQKLCAKYGLKGNGKNVEMIARLQEFGATLPPQCHLFVGDDFDDENEHDDENMQVDEDVVEFPSSPSSNSNHRHRPQYDTNPQSPSSPATIPRPPSPLQSRRHEILPIGYPPKRSLPIIYPQPFAQRNRLGIGKQSKDSEWEMLTEGQTSLIVHPKEITLKKLGVLEAGEDQENGTGTSTKSWKSARNGGRLDEFGTRTAGVFESVRRTSGSLSHKASIKRLTSSLSLKRSFIRSSAPQSPPHLKTVEYDPPSPAPKVGVVTRHRNQLGRGPSTIRLVGSQEMLGEMLGEMLEDPVGARGGGWEGDETLPLWGGKERMSQKETNEEEREVLMSVDSAEKQRPITSIYPSALGTHPPLPGSFPTSSSTAPAFIFGSQSGDRVSDEQFGEAAKAVLEAMNRKLEVKGVRGIGQSDAVAVATIDTRMKRGGRAGRHVGGGDTGRFDESHRKEFARMDSISNHYAAKRVQSSNNIAGAPTLNTQARTATKRKPSDGQGSSIAVVDNGKKEYAESPRGKRMRADEDGRGIVTAPKGVEGLRNRSWVGRKLVVGSTGATSGSRMITSGTEAGPSKSAGRNIFATSANALKRTFAALGRPSGSPRRPIDTTAVPTGRPPLPAPAYKKALPSVPSILHHEMKVEPQVARSKSTNALRLLKKASPAQTPVSGNESGSFRSSIPIGTVNHPYNLPRPHSDLDLARSLRYAKSSSHLPQPPKRDIATAAVELRKRSRPAPPPPVFEGKSSTAPLAILTPGRRMAAAKFGPGANTTCSTLYTPTTASLAKMQPAAREAVLSGGRGGGGVATASSNSKLNKTPAGKRRLIQKTTSTGRAGYGGTATHQRHLASPIRARASNADMAMAMKHQELLERRRKRVEEGRLLDVLMGRGENGLTVHDMVGREGR